MSHKLIIKPEAEEDIQDIFDWYERKAKGLGEYFLDDLDSKIKKIKNQPEIYQFHLFIICVLLVRWNALNNHSLV